MTPAPVTDGPLALAACRIAVASTLALCCCTPLPKSAPYQAPVRAPISHQGTEEPVTEPSAATAEGEEYDPSDPTRVDARTGGGFKYTDFSGSAYLLELRAKAAIQLNPKDLLTVDIGVGESIDVPNQSDESGLTDGRFRYFRMWDVDRSVLAGWQGWGTSVEVQTPGNVPGTDGSALLALGGMGAVGLGEGFSSYLNPIVSSIWNRSVNKHLGVAIRGDLFLTYKPGTLWDGAYFKVKPSVSYGVSNAIDGQLGANVEASLGGAFSKRFWWDVQWRTFLEQDLDLVTEGRESGLADDWSLFLSFTYFL